MTDSPKNIFKISKDYIHPESGEVKIRVVHHDDPKQKKKTNVKKQRHVTIKSKFNETKPDAIEFKDFRNFKFKSGDSVAKPEQSSVELSYDRTNKSPKTLNKADAPKGDVTACPNFALLDYDLTIAVDTNTIHMEDFDVSVACSIQFFVQKEGQGVLVNATNPFCFEFNAISEKHENYAWMCVIKDILASSGYKKTHKIALIVDSDLGNIDSYNSGEKPIYKDFFLPESIQLIYASAERATTEYAANGMIAQCEKEAKKVLNLRKEQNYKKLGPSKFRTYKVQRKE